ncbi:DUF3238 domain-containing protein [Bacillus xiapuensis]|uniref:DUF3238 domain-containing protein n=1 Tax=Bacillus xiapuensis TaxID=2014075 RepID=UPI0012FDEC5A|nr:DUF3238 domain-containing protein [Bacillus xiapuensis]
MKKGYLIGALASAAGAALLMNRDKKRQRMADPPQFMLKKVKQTADEISLEWTDTEANYRVYRQGQLIYEGARSSAKDRGLMPATSYLYTIEKTDTKGRVLDLIKVQTATKPEKRRQENILQDWIMTSVVGRTFISMEWEPIDGIEEYTIYRNGKRLAHVTDSFYIDQTVRPQEEYTYWIRAERPLAQSEENLSEEKFAAAGVIGFFKKGAKEKEAMMEVFRIAKLFDSIEAILRPKDSSQEHQWQLRYTTFLPMKRLKNPNFFSMNRYFAGDGRGFEPEADRFRTRADLAVSFADDKPSVRLNKAVGLSKAYGWTGRLREKGRASEGGIQLENVQTGKEKVEVLLKHSVGNPLTASPNIDYEITASFYRNGFFDFTGNHDQSPNHEMYLKRGRKNYWKPLHQARSKGLEWLAATMASQYWRVSNFK